MLERAQLIKYGQQAAVTLAALIIGPYAIKASIDFLPGVLMLAGVAFVGYKVAWPAMKKAGDFATQTASSLWSSITSCCSRAKNMVANIFSRDAAQSDLRADNAGLDDVGDNLQDDTADRVLENELTTVTPASKRKSSRNKNDTVGDETQTSSPSRRKKRD